MPIQLIQGIHLLKSIHCDHHLATFPSVLRIALTITRVLLLTQAEEQKTGIGLGTRLTITGALTYIVYLHAMHGFLYSMSLVLSQCCVPSLTMYTDDSDIPQDDSDDPQDDSDVPQATPGGMAGSGGSTSKLGNTMVMLGLV